LWRGAAGIKSPQEDHLPHFTIATMAEVLPLQLPDGQPYFSSSSLRRSTPSQSSIFIGSPSYPSRKPTYSSVALDEPYTDSVSSSSSSSSSRNSQTVIVASEEWSAITRYTQAVIHVKVGVKCQTARGRRGERGRLCKVGLRVA